MAVNPSFSFMLPLLSSHVLTLHAAATAQRDTAHAGKRPLPDNGRKRNFGELAPGQLEQRRLHGGGRAGTVTVESEGATREGEGSHRSGGVAEAKSASLPPSSLTFHGLRVRPSPCSAGAARSLKFRLLPLS